jgi:hypothetical protein
VGRGLAHSPPAAGQWETLMPGGLAALSPGVALQRGLLSLSHEVRTINPFKSPLLLPLVTGREAGPGLPGLDCLTMSWASVLLSDLCRLRTHRPLLRGMRSRRWHSSTSRPQGWDVGKEQSSCYSLLLSLMRYSLRIVCQTDNTGQTP